MAAAIHIYTLHEMAEYGNRLQINTIINFIINFLAAYLVLKYSTKAMKIYKYYILLTIFCAFLMDFHITFIFGPYVMLPASILCGAGFVSIRAGLFWGMHFQYFLMHITHSCVGWSIIFGAMYQYSFLNGNTEFFHKFRGICFISLTMLFYGMPSYLIVFTSIDREATIEYVKDNFPNSFDLFMKASCHAVILNAHGKIYYAILCLQILIACVIGIFVSMRILRKLSEKKGILSKATLKARKQLFISLAFQATIPIILLFDPTVLIFVSIGFGWNKINLISNFALPIISFHSSANALSIIFVITPYRRALIQGLKRILFCHKSFTPITIEFTSPSNRRMTYPNI